ncbi:hypothetical protein DL767_000649 [Monosporascus sp. MG133]|nr:hypothetical protein DL767_000649 [Monosporascus sp. MG133]
MRSMSSYEGVASSGEVGRAGPTGRGRIRYIHIAVLIQEALHSLLQDMNLVSASVKTKIKTPRTADEVMLILRTLSKQGLYFIETALQGPCIRTTGVNQEATISRTASIGALRCNPDTTEPHLGGLLLIDAQSRLRRHSQGFLKLWAEITGLGMQMSGLL